MLLHAKIPLNIFKGLDYSPRARVCRYSLTVTNLLMMNTAGSATEYGYVSLYLLWVR